MTVRDLAAESDQHLLLGLQPEMPLRIGPDDAQTPFGAVGGRRDRAGLRHRGNLHAGCGMGEAPRGETRLAQCRLAGTREVGDIMLDNRIVLERLDGHRRLPLLGFGQLPARLLKLDLPSCQPPQDPGMLGQSAISLRGPNLTKPDIAAAIAKRPVCAELTIVRDTILSAFVSEAKFPASRESTGNFRYSGANGTKIAKRHV
jgi:hypothetical protein